MKAAVRYFTRSGNTKKLADAVGAATGAEVLDVSVDLSEKTELLFLGSSVYAGKFDASVGDFLDRNSDRIGTIVCFGSSASGKSTWKKIGNWAAENGVSVCEKYYNCPGHFLFLHKERPNESDLREVSEFAKSVCAAVSDQEAAN